jgi:circadian clock protein KaiC
VEGVERLETGIPGVDALTKGGFPKRRTTLACGTSGSGKTLIAMQFLVEGIKHYDTPGVFVALEESPEDITRNVQGMGWDIQKMIDDGKWVYVDGAIRHPEDENYLGGDFDLQPLVDRIIAAIKRVGADRVSVDSLSALLCRFSDSGLIRREMFRLTQALREAGVTSLITAERIQDGNNEITRYGVEEYVVDNVVILRNRSDETRRRRTIEILKLRGGAHATGEFPFSITDSGLQAIPVGTMSLTSPSTGTRISSGNELLDEMCGGGFFQDSVSIVAGATGTGKTLTATTFLKGGANEGQRSLFFGFEESQPQIFRNAHSWGIDLEGYHKSGNLKMQCAFPESGSLEDHLNEIRHNLEHFEPQRIVVDSISALQRIGSDHAFREFVIGLTSVIKQHQVAGLYTTTSEQLIGGNSVTGQHISTLTDAIIMLRYAEMKSRLSRGITVLKMRGSPHEKMIREFDISEQGMNIGEPFKDLNVILTGA